MKIARRVWVALLAAALGLLSAAGCGGVGGPAKSPAAPPGTAEREAIARREAALASTDDAAPAGGAQGPGAAETASLEEQLVIEGWLTVQVDDVRAAAEAIRARIEAAGGRVVSEQLRGAELSWSGTMKLRVPPGEVEELSGWLAGLGEVTHRRVQGTDVSRQLFDQEIALENLELTLGRLRSLLEREDLEMSEILSIEKEMTRLRGEIERIKGENRWLRDRVALATFHITLERREGAVLGPEAKIFPGARGSLLTLLDADGRPRNRLGAGIVVHPFAPGGAEETGSRMTIEADVFEGPEGADTAALVTLGGAVYSDFLGRGRNLLLNPYLGARAGYGYLDGSAFAFAGTVGLEVVKTKFFLLDLSVRGVGLAGENGFDPALVSAAGLTFAF